MNIIRAFISQLYGFAGIAAIDKRRSLNTIRSISFNLTSYLLYRLLGAGRLKPLWFNDFQLPYALGRDLFTPLRYSTRRNLK